MDETHDIVVVGAGPAGMAAAIYLQRAGLNPVLLEKGEPGGLLLSANLVENYPGFPGGITGRDLVKRFVEQLGTVGVVVTEGHVTSVRFSDGLFYIETEERTYVSRAVILATGTRPRKLEIKGITQLEERTVFYDLEGLLVNASGVKRIIIVGGGDSAFDYAINLHDRGHKVKVICRSIPRCLPLLKKRADDRGIEVCTGCLPVEIYSHSDVVHILCVSDGRRIEHEGDMVLIACGRVPDLEVLSDDLRRSLDTFSSPPETDVPGLFLAGDVVRKKYRQTGIAIGDGILAAMLAERYLRNGEVNV